MEYIKDKIVLLPQAMLLLFLFKHPEANGLHHRKQTLSVRAGDQIWLKILLWVFETGKRGRVLFPYLGVVLQVQLDDFTVSVLYNRISCFCRQILVINFESGCTKIKQLNVRNFVLTLQPPAATPSADPAQIIVTLQQPTAVAQVPKAINGNGGADRVQLVENFDNFFLFVCVKNSVLEDRREEMLREEKHVEKGRLGGGHLWAVPVLVVN